MALDPHSEQPDLGAPPDYAVDHPHEHPEQWGWHGEWGRSSRAAGIIVAIIFILMLTTTHYNASGTVWLIGIAAAMIVVVIWDIQRRKHSWRK